MTVEVAHGAPGWWGEIDKQEGGEREGRKEEQVIPCRQVPIVRSHYFLHGIMNPLPA